MTLKGFLKSVNIWRRYGPKYGGMFLAHGVFRPTRMYMYTSFFTKHTITVSCLITTENDSGTSISVVNFIEPQQITA